MTIIVFFMNFIKKTNELYREQIIVSNNMKVNKVKGNFCFPD